MIPFRFRGLSIIEVLVVLAVIGLLIAILLPAIQDARETSRRIACANKLRQVGIAINSYLSDSGAFPAIMFNSTSSGTGGPWDFHVHLLPALGFGETYNALNLSLHWTSAENTTVTFRSPNIFLCPSDISPRQRSDVGFTNYHSCGGSGVFSKGLDVEFTALDEPHADGVFGTAPVRPQDLIDGFSTTAVVCEQIHGAEYKSGVPPALPVPTLGLTYHIKVLPPTQRNLIGQCESLDSAAGNDADPSGARWPIARVYTHLFTPGKASCFAGNLGTLYSPLTANSRHRKGVNVLFADDHVQFIGNSVDAKVWQALGSRDGGEQRDRSF